MKEELHVIRAIVYFVGLFAGCGWSIFLFSQASDSAAIQASIAPAVIGYLFAECIGKGLGALADRHGGG